MDIGAYMGIAGFALSVVAFWVSRQDRHADERKALGDSIDQLRKDLVDHRVEDARMYVNREDLRGVTGRIEALITRVDDLAVRGR